jgi:hypothetical protein
MANKWYRIPVANSVVKIDSIEYVTPVVVINPAGTGETSSDLYGFRVVYNEYSSVNRMGTGMNTSFDFASFQNGFNGTVVGVDKEKLEGYRNDLVNLLTNNGVDLIDNFPGE